MDAGSARRGGRRVRVAGGGRGSPGLPVPAVPLDHRRSPGSGVLLPFESRHRSAVQRAHRRPPGRGDRIAVVEDHVVQGAQDTVRETPGLRDLLQPSVARGRDAGDRESGVRARGRSRRVGGGLVLCFVFFFSTSMQRSVAAAVSHLEDMNDAFLFSSSPQNKPS